jgi:hypothetical protein
MNRVAVESGHPPPSLVYLPTYDRAVRAAAQAITAAH